MIEKKNNFQIVKSTAAHEQKILIEKATLTKNEEKRANANFYFNN